MRNVTVANRTALGALDVVATPPWPAAPRRSSAASIRAGAGVVLGVLGVVAGELALALARSAADRADALGSGLVADGRRRPHGSIVGDQRDRPW